MMMKKIANNTGSNSVTPTAAPKRHSLLKFYLIVLGAGLLGALSSILFSYVQDQVGPAGDALLVWLADVLPAAQWVSCAVFAGGALLLYWLGRAAILKLEKNGGEDDALAQRAESLTGLGMICNNVLLVVGYWLFGMYAALPQVGLMIVPALGMLIFIMVFSTAYSVAGVKLAKRLNPQKKGDPLEVRFEKEWFQSCDEGERMQIYEAAYAAYKITSTVLVAIWVVTVIISFFCEIGPYPVTVVSAIWFCHTVTYQYHAMRGKKKKQNPKNEA